MAQTIQSFLTSHTGICAQSDVVGVLSVVVCSVPPHSTGIISSSYTALPPIHIVKTFIYIRPLTASNPLKPSPRAFLSHDHPFTMGAPKKTLLIDSDTMTVKASFASSKNPLRLSKGNKRKYVCTSFTFFSGCVHAVCNVCAHAFALQCAAP